MGRVSTREGGRPGAGPVPYLISADEMTAVLPLDEAIRTQRAAFVEYASGRARTPQRTIMPVSRGSALVMPAWLERSGDLGVKVLTAYPGNSDERRPANQALVVLFDEASGSPLAVLDGTWITAVRTGVAAALGVDSLARADARALAVLGSGPVAYWAARAASLVRPIETVHVYSRRKQHADRLVAELAEPLHGRQVRASPGLAGALGRADVVVAATAATAPLIGLADARAGLHVSSVGELELGAAFLARARVVVDSAETWPAEAADLGAAVASGILRRDAVSADLGSVLAGLVPGRSRDDEITVFKSTGLGFQDVALAGEVTRRVRAHR